MKLYDVIRKERLQNDKQFSDSTIEKAVHHDAPAPNVNYKRQSPWKKLFIIGGAGILLVGLYVAGMYMVRAQVTIVERRIPFSLTNAELELLHEKDAAQGRLSFQTMVVEATISREVYGSELRASTSKARGKVVFFNELSTTAKTVKSGTTLTAQNGKRYITQASVTVPGYTTDTKTKKKTAGTSASVLVVAEETGPAYNTNGTSFSVSGFGSSKTFYAQSAGVISGGESGMMHGVSNADRPEVMATLTAQLTERLKRETRTQIPENLITYPNLQFVSINTDLLKLEGPEVKFPATISGTMVSYLISRELLESAIATKAVSGATLPRVSVPTLANLSVDPISAIPTSPTRVPESITIRVSGSGTLIPKASISEVTDVLVGLPRTKFVSALAAIPEIDTARYSLLPFWSPFFPTKESRIKVEVK